MNLEGIESEPVLQEGVPPTMVSLELSVGQVGTRVLIWHAMPSKPRPKGRGRHKHLRDRKRREKRAKEAARKAAKRKAGVN